MRTPALASPSEKEEKAVERRAAADPERRPDGEPLPLDVLYGLLSNERRRRTLRYLHEKPETTLGEIAEHIAAIENDKPVDAITSTERKRVYICLYQCHLPKLDDADVIEFDRARKTVRPSEYAADVKRFLPGIPGDDTDDRVTDWTSPLTGIRSRLRRALPRRLRRDAPESGRPGR